MSNNGPKYLHCTKYKGQPQKHVVICRECRWKKNCRPYQNYRQPELPFNFRKEL